MKATVTKRGQYYYATLVRDNGEKIVASEPMATRKAALKHAQAWLNAKRWGF